ncbi:hypothetical protein ACTNDG_07715 [Clostridium sp. HCP1S3_B4]|uniref:hypothetical protein n=1 Tax=unclassified Clostridium TaxID=2614128 RepID=UPI003F89965E
MNNEKYNSKVKVNSDNVAFSPNNDNVKDDVQLMTYFLRNAREYKVEVLDKNKNLVGNTRKFNDRTKNLYSYYIQYSLAGLFNEGYSWNGTYYDESTGNNKVVDDGQANVSLALTNCANLISVRLKDFLIGPFLNFKVNFFAILIISIYYCLLLVVFLFDFSMPPEVAEHIGIPDEV